MKKLKLDLGELRVEAFQPARADTRGGTAFGYITGLFGPACKTDYPNCIDNTASGVAGPDCLTEPPNCA
jgi:hypothetical protein